jgi:NDP-sugar pyrophosphorylase family protein
MLPVAILAGGLATRMRPHTERVPKALLDVGGRPFAAHQVTLLARHGVTHIVFCVGHLGEEVQSALGDGSRWGVRLTYVFDGPRLRGTGGALKGALPHLGRAFFVLYGDSYLDCDYGAVERAYRGAGRLGLMTVFRNDERWDASNVHFDGVRIHRYSKRDRVPEMRHIDYGLGVLDARALDPYSDDGHLDLATIYADLLARGELAGFEVTRRFYEIGSPAGLEELRRHLAGGDVP